MKLYTHSPRCMARRARSAGSLPRPAVARLAAGAALALGAIWAGPAMAQTAGSYSMIWQGLFPGATTTGVQLNNPTVVDTSGVTYTFPNSNWSRTNGGCNGWVASSSSTTAPPTTGANGDAGCAATNGHTVTVVKGVNTVSTTARTAWQNVTQGLAAALDLKQAGTDVVAFMTNAGNITGTNAQFKSSAGIPLQQGHYYMATAWFSAVHCAAGPTGVSSGVAWTDPSETLYLSAGAGGVPQAGATPPTYPVLFSGVNPCNITGGGAYTSATDGLIAYGQQTLTSTGAAAVLVPGVTSSSPVSGGIELDNKTLVSGGNDMAVADIELYDVTPTLYKSFDPNLYDGANYTNGPAAATPLTFTIVNTAELAAKNGWTFTDTLPGGLQVADPAAVPAGKSLYSTTCDTIGGGFSPAPAKGDLSVTIKANLLQNELSCTVTVYVQQTDTTKDNFNYTNDATNVTTYGLNPPNTTMLNIANLVVNKSVASVTNSILDPLPANTVLEAGDIITYQYEIVNPTGSSIKITAITDPATDTVNTPPIVANLTNPPVNLSTPVCGGITPSPATPVTLPGNSSTTCTATYTVQPADITGGGPLVNVATATDDGGDTSPISSTSTTVGKTGLTVTLNESTQLLTVGETVTYTVTVTNTGTVPLTEVTIDTGSLFKGAGVPSGLDCGATPYPLDLTANGGAVTCTYTYVVQPGDATAGIVKNTVTANGYVPGVSTPAFSKPATSLERDLLPTGAPTATAVPALDERALALLALLLGGLAWLTQRKMRR